ncbi:hypothetical protein H6P81_010245 [Aristolochia fimbriata]|uniref:Uncharacterized protein n=1 Tax=Aristolochia fimbriata TaxID=158543 RepID=A0AAV7EQC2_ARIFI|nr:hypothetical protein H6P81_010245 [Aristolochia fimbriata]
MTEFWWHSHLKYQPEVDLFRPLPPWFKHLGVTQLNYLFPFKPLTSVIKQLSIEFHKPTLSLLSTNMKEFKPLINRSLFGCNGAWQMGWIKIQVSSPMVQTPRSNTIKLPLSIQITNQCNQAAFN